MSSSRSFELFEIFLEGPRRPTRRRSMARWSSHDRPIRLIGGRLPWSSPRRSRAGRCWAGKASGVIDQHDSADPSPPGRPAARSSERRLSSSIGSNAGDPGSREQESRPGWLRGSLPRSRTGAGSPRSATALIPPANRSSSLCTVPAPLATIGRVSISNQNLRLARVEVHRDHHQP